MEAKGQNSAIIVCTYCLHALGVKSYAWHLSKHFIESPIEFDHRERVREDSEFVSYLQSKEKRQLFPDRYEQLRAEYKQKSNLFIEKYKEEMARVRKERRKQDVIQKKQKRNKKVYSIQKAISIQEKIKDRFDREYERHCSKKLLVL